MARGECLLLYHESKIKMIPNMMLFFERTTCQLKIFPFDKWILNELQPFSTLSFILTLSAFNLIEPLLTIAEGKVWINFLYSAFGSWGVQTIMEKSIGIF